MEQVIKTITTKKGGKVSLIKPDNGNPFFRYMAGAVATTDSFRYVIRQHGQEDTATVNVQVKLPQQDQPDDQKEFMRALNGFLNCVDAFMDGSPSIMALTNLMGIDEGDVLNDDWVRQVFQSFRYFDNAKDHDHFYMADYAGTYEFDLQDGYWHYKPGDDTVELHFPSGPEKKENDATWRLGRFDMQVTKTKSDVNYLPTAVDTELRIGKDQVFSLVTDDIEYFEDTIVPTNLHLQAKVPPYGLRLSMESENGQEFDIQAQVSDADGCQLDLDTRWMVNQDLRQKLQEDHIIMLRGRVAFNEIEVEGLETLYMAARDNISEQDKLDDLLQLVCSLDGKEIGHLRYINSDEVVELVFKDGNRLDLTQIIQNHFKEYFNASKPDGTARNTAFDMASHSTMHRSAPKPAADTKAAGSKVLDSLNQAMTRRTIRMVNKTPAVVAGVSTVFKREETKINPPATPGIIDNTGAIIPLVDTGTISEAHGKLFTLPDSVVVAPATFTAETLASVSEKPKSTTVKPVTTAAKTTTAKPKTATVKATTAKATTVKKAATGKTTIKPVSAKEKITPKTTVKSTTAKKVTSKATTTKPSTSKTTKTTKPK